MDQQIRDEFKKKLDDFNKQIIDEDASNPTMQNFIAKYVFINANENQLSYCYFKVSLSDIISDYVRCDVTYSKS